MPAWLLYAVIGAVVLLGLVALIRFIGLRQTGQGGLDLTGTWRTNYGQLSLSQSGQHIAGTYGGNGGLTGEVNGNTVTGYWERNGTTVLCPQERDGTRWWGRFTWTVNEANTSFTGANSACEAEPRPPVNAWSGARVGPPP
jgi:hypothetical protein